MQWGRRAKQEATVSKFYPWKYWITYGKLDFIWILK